MAIKNETNGAKSAEPVTQGNGMSLSPLGNSMTMSSREIAELVESRHDKVKQSMERLAERGVITLPPLGETSFKDSSGKTQWVKEYRVGKRDSYVVVAQLCPEFTARLVDRWQELESKAASGAPLIPQSLPEALRLAADLAEQKARVESQLALAAPKAEALDRIADAEGTMNLTVAAKNLQVQPKKFFDWMRQHLWIYRRPGGSGNVAYQDKIRAG